MLYAILCYDSEEVVCNWSKEKDDAVMVRLGEVQQKLAKAGRLGPVARLAPTKAAKTVRKGMSSHVIDGPFAETKEQILGFFVVDCGSMDEAVEAAQELGRAHGGDGAFEVRPLNYFQPNKSFQ
jgi:hypothetical protein